MKRLPAAFCREFRGVRSERPPVSTYEQAVMWLVQAYRLYERPLADREPMMPAGLLVCDLFWITEKNLRADLNARYREFAACFEPSRRRGPFARTR